MKKSYILILLFSLFAVNKSMAQVVTVEAKIDSLQILIGEQAKIELQVSSNPNQIVVFPTFRDTLRSEERRVGKECVSTC